MYATTLDLIYLLAAVLFIIGIKLLGSPATAMRGNAISAVAMALAIAITVIAGNIHTYSWIIAGAAIGAVIGVVASRMVQMTAMPQMVALYNGLGGAASGFVASNEFFMNNANITGYLGLVICLSLFVGFLTLSGSLVAFGKLQELVTGRAVVFPMQHLLNILLLAGAVVLGVMLTMDPSVLWVYLALVGIALLLGVLVVIPIGGADMPVVIALLNSYSGIAVSFTGFVLANNALIIVGALVGASGIFLTNEMCVGMNRSIWNVLFGGFGATSTVTAEGAQVAQGQVKPYTLEDATTVIENASSVIIIPGYGMAAAQAQHQVRAFSDALDKMGIEVRYAIHPVAGRMPGHMNVLLAEANVPYDLLLDMDEINEDFKNTDVALVVGANDVVNPAAEEDPSSPIYGMPILNAEQARTVMVLKRSMNPGFAGIENALFLKDNTMMLFGDAKSTLGKLVDLLADR